MHADRAIVIVNRLARRAGSRGWLEAVRSALGRRFHVESHYPRDAEETAATAHESSRGGGTVVIAAGGDGTVNAVANGLPAQALLGILPLGTANDLARALGIPRDPASAARRIAEGRPHPMDLVDVNGRRFCTVGGLGLVSRSTTNASRLKGHTPLGRRVGALLGQAVYKLAAAGSVLERKISGRGRMRWHDPDANAERSAELDVHGLFVTNNLACGGGLVIPTGGRADDGVFELATIPTTSRARLLVNLARLSSGRPLGEGVLSIVRAARAELEMEDEQLFVADGEVVATGRTFTIAARPGAVTVIR